MLLLVGIDINPSSTVLRELATLAASDSRLSDFVCRSSRGIFHPKAYVVSAGQTTHSFVGSGNCTDAGLKNSTELFAYCTERATAEQLLSLCREWQAVGMQLTDSITEGLLEVQVAGQERSKNELQQYFNSLLAARQQAAPASHLDVDFTDYWFDQADYQAFSNEAQLDESEQANAQRRVVRNKLYNLNERLQPVIHDKVSSDLHAHYRNENIVSSYKHSDYTTDRIQTMWLHYSRGATATRQLEKYVGKGNTEYNLERPAPRWQPRIQVAVDYEGLSVWLRFGKPGGSALERIQLKKTLNSRDGLQAWTDLLAKLSPEYVLQIKDEKHSVEAINTPERIQATLGNDDRASYAYLIRRFAPFDARLREGTIVESIVSEMKVLWPLYRALVEPVDRG